MPPPDPVSRRAFLKGAGTLVAGAAVVGCEPAAPDRPARGQAARPLPRSIPVPGVIPGFVGFFTPHEAAAVEAFTARIIPGDPDDPNDPGAREAGVVYYIDRMLSSGDGHAEPTYRSSPFAVAYEGDEPPPADPAAGQYEVVMVPEEQMERYGPQSPLTPRDFYRRGLAALDAYANSAAGADFAELTEDQQDAVVRALAGDEVDDFEDPDGLTFFETLRTHTIHGMFSDPVHGGNRDMVGWTMLGFPGAQRAYTPAEMLTEGTNRQPQGLHHLPVFNPGQPDRPGAVHPVRGTHDGGRSK